MCLVTQSCLILCNPLDCNHGRSMGFLRQEYWSGLPFHFPRDLPKPWIKPRSPTLQANSLPTETGVHQTAIEWMRDTQHMKAGTWPQAQRASVILVPRPGAVVSISLSCVAPLWWWDTLPNMQTQDQMSSFRLLGRAPTANRLLSL